MQLEIQFAFPGINGKWCRLAFAHFLIEWRLYR